MIGDLDQRALFGTRRDVLVTNFFATYRASLAELIGKEAAGVGTSYYKWTVVGLLLIASATPLALVANPGGSGLGLTLILLATCLGILCGVRAVMLSARCGILASAYLTDQWRRPVRVAGVRISLRWWRWRIQQERERMGP